MLHLADIASTTTQTPQKKCYGRVVSIKGPIIHAKIPHSAIGDLCYIHRQHGAALPAQVVAFEEDLISLAPFDNTHGIAPGAKVENAHLSPTIKLSETMLGCVVDPLGQIVYRLSPKPEHDTSIERNIASKPPAPLSRSFISTQLCTGIKAIDGLCSIGYGQRIGLFSEAGVGKSTLLGMIARNAEVDVCVIALVGERGREVKEFIDECLGQEALKKSVLVVATSDESSIRRKLAAMTATCIAEYYREQGKKVLLLVDSLTRMSRAIREVTLAAGELPVRQGYTSSVYTELPAIVERAGTSAHGSITAIYTVLTNGENESDPLGDEIKSLLDGHIVLSRALAERGVRPAIDPTISVSRLMRRLHSEEYLACINTILKVLSRLKKDKDLLLFGGSPDAELKACLAVEQELLSVLTQLPAESYKLQETMAKFLEINDKFEKQ